MTRDGYAFIVGKITGKTAAQHQIAYIEAFNAMAAFIKNQRDGLTYRYLQKELECKDSASRGSFHGRGLNQRKREKPVLESELAQLQAIAQPTLLN
jgi:phage regulator Rha-like protein